MSSSSRRSPDQHVPPVVKHKTGEKDLAAVKRKEQAGFRKLRKVLREIQTMVKKGGVSGMINLFYDKGILKIHGRKSKENFLPEDSLALSKRQ